MKSIAIQIISHLCTLLVHGRQGHRQHQSQMDVSVDEVQPYCRATALLGPPVPYRVARNMGVVVRVLEY